MSSFLSSICCCFTWPSTPDSITIDMHKKAPKNSRLPKKSRIQTRFSSKDILQITKSQKQQGLPAYTCPICTLYYNRILSCSDCENLMCKKCVRSYERKYVFSKQEMRCPFCNSQKSLFADYELEPKQYFDSTGGKKKEWKQGDKREKEGGKYRDVDGDKENNMNLGNAPKNDDSTSTSGLPTDRNQPPLKQINILNQKARDTIRYSSSLSTTNDQSTQDQILPQGYPRQNPENGDLSFIDQFQLRTVGDEGSEGEGRGV